MLLEVIISALLVGLIAVGTFTGLQGATRAGAGERANAQATVIAQQDEDRLRGLTVKELSNLGETTYHVAENGMCVEQVASAWKYWNGATTTACEAVTGYKGKAYTGTVFTVTSSAQFATAAEDKLTCTTEKGKADYIQTTSSVNWPSVGTHSPVSQSSLVAVPTSSSLLVKVKNRINKPVTGATVAVTDPSTGSTVTAEETTPTSGCVIFGDLAEGEVKVVASKENWVAHNGKTSPEKSVKVSTTSLAETELTLESPGAIEAKFESNGQHGVPSFTFVAFQNEVAAAGPFFVGGEASKASTSAVLPTLFPFITPGNPEKEDAYTVYAGDCEANNPAEVTKGLGASNEVRAKTVQVEPGPTKSVEVEAPPVSVTVDEGESVTNHGNPLSSSYSATVINPECKGKTAQTTVPYKHEDKIVTGKLEVPYLPYAKQLELCVVAKIGSYYYKNTSSFSNTAKTGTTASTVYLTSSSSKKTTNAETC